MKFSIMISLFAGLGIFVATAQAGSLSSSLLSKVKAEGTLDLIAELPQIIDQVQLSLHSRNLKGPAKVAALISSLKSLTSTTQAPLLKHAAHLGIRTESFWASNIVLLKAVNSSTLASLAGLNHDFLLREPHTVSVPSLEKATPAYAHKQQQQQQPVQWNIEKIRAPEAWETTQGEGAVVGSIDTGVNLGHEAFQSNFGGDWLDPFYNSAVPDDAQGHGSHTLGVILGQTNGIGVAPASRWVACRGLNNQGSGTESSLTTCAQFILSLDPLPCAVNNAWGGGTGSWFNAQISAWKAAGIVPVFAAGGSGPGCSSIGHPGDTGSAIAVGRTTQADELHSSSARGPSFGGDIKPDVVAPAINIVSAGTGSNNYVTMSGTSAGSHVSGVVALIASAHPGATVDEIFEILRTSAFQPDLQPNEDYCGPSPIPNPSWPNNAWGYGRVDAAGAVARLSKKFK